MHYSDALNTLAGIVTCKDNQKCHSHYFSLHFERILSVVLCTMTFLQIPCNIWTKFMRLIYLLWVNLVNPLKSHTSKVHLPFYLFWWFFLLGSSPWRACMHGALYAIYSMQSWALCWTLPKCKQGPTDFSLLFPVLEIHKCAPDKMNQNGWQSKLVAFSCF